MDNEILSTQGNLTHRLFLDNILQEITGLNNPDHSEWYKITDKDFKERFGTTIIKNYKGSVCLMIISNYAESNLLPWKFQTVYFRFWKEEKNEIWFRDWLSQELKIKSKDDWYKYGSKEIYDNGGSRLITGKYKTYYNLINNFFPDCEWIPWKFKIVPMGFWNKKENRNWFIKWFVKENGYNEYEKMYNITFEILSQSDGRGILDYYKHYFEAIIETFPEFDWEINRFGSHGVNFWDDPKNRRKWLDKLFYKKRFKVITDWYKSTNSDFRTKDYIALYERYNCSYTNIIKDNYPEVEWLDWKFNKVPNNYWTDINNQYKYLFWYFKKKNFKIIEDLYKVSNKDIIKYYGYGLLGVYGGSAINMIKSLFPKYTWLDWKFKTAPMKFWQSEENCKKYLEWLAKELHIFDFSDWYKVSSKIVCKYYGRVLLRVYQSLSKALQQIYPEHNWQVEKFMGTTKCQRLIYKFLKFNWDDTEWEYRNDLLKFKNTGYHMSFDCFIPSLNIAIEYQGSQHYIAKNNWGGQESFDRLTSNDKEKKEKCKDLGIKLLEIHYLSKCNKQTLYESINTLTNSPPGTHLFLDSKYNKEKVA